MTFLVALVLRMAVKPHQNDISLAAFYPASSLPSDLSGKIEGDSARRVAACSRLSDLPSCNQCDLDVDRLMVTP